VRRVRERYGWDHVAAATREGYAQLAPVGRPAAVARSLTAAAL